MINRGDLLLSHPSEHELLRMEELMGKYNDRPMDFADASLVALAERLALTKIFTVDRSDFSTYHGHRNLVWTFFKDMPAPLLALYLPQHLLLNIASVAWFAAHGRARVILRAKWDALRGLPAVLAARRTVQAPRRVSWRVLRQAMRRLRPNASWDQACPATSRASSRQCARPGRMLGAGQSRHSASQG